MGKLDKRLNDLETGLEGFQKSLDRSDRLREATIRARELHPVEFAKFDTFLGDFSAKHSELSGRAALIELSKDQRALDICRELTELVGAQIWNRSDTLQ